MDTRIVNHRRDRRIARLILADIRLRYRGLTLSSFRAELDPVIDGHDRLVIPHPCVFTRGR